MVEGAAGEALRDLGDGNWRMGEGKLPPKKGAKLGAGDEAIIIEHYICKFHSSSVVPVSIND